MATPRHLGRLVVLHAALEELRSALSETEWRHRWQLHHQRLCDVLDHHSTDAERAHAVAATTDAERELVGRLLDGELST